MNKHLTILVPEPLLSKIEAASSKEDRSVSAWLRIAAQERLARIAAEKMENKTRKTQ